MFVNLALNGLLENQEGFSRNHMLNIDEKKTRINISTSKKWANCKSNQNSRSLLTEIDRRKYASIFSNEKRESFTGTFT